MRHLQHISCSENIYTPINTDTHRKEVEAGMLSLAEQEERNTDCYCHPVHELPRENCVKVKENTWVEKQNTESPEST